MRRLTAVPFLSACCFFLFLVACSGESGPAATATPTPVPTPTPIPITVSATELRVAYENNEVAAKQKFEGQMALISGAVDSVTEAGAKYDVKLSTDEFLSITNIVCKVDKSDVDSVLALNEGQTVTVIGRVKGKGIFDIEVEDCSVR